MSNKAILIHGRHVETDGWEQVVLGSLARKQTGTLARGILEAYRQKADLIYFGTGASSKDGLFESEYTYQIARSHWRELAQLCGADDSGDMHVNPFFNWLTNVSFLDTESKNTAEEVRKCLALCVERRITQLTLVSAPFHIPRCMQQAQIVFEDLASDTPYQELRRNWFGVASDVNPTGMDTSDVVIVEPMHRGDNPKVPFYRQIRRIFQFLRNPELAFEFCDELEKFINKYEERLKNK